MQRREFHLINSASWQWFRLQIDSVSDPTNASFVQLAGLDLLFANPMLAAERLTALVRSQGEFPPFEIVENLFDNNAKQQMVGWHRPDQHSRPVGSNGVTLSAMEHRPLIWTGTKYLNRTGQNTRNCAWTPPSFHGPPRRHSWVGRSSRFCCASIFRPGRSIWRRDCAFI
jgi:hypothetical protein